jgi:hypothetical protein
MERYRNKDKSVKRNRMRVREIERGINSAGKIQRKVETVSQRDKE